MLDRFQKLLLSLACVIALAIGYATDNADAGTAYYTPVASPSSVPCSSDQSCKTLQNIQVTGVTYLLTTGIGIYTWNGTCPGSPDGSTYIRPTGASVGCFVINGFASLTSASAPVYKPVASISALSALASPATVQYATIPGYYAGTFVGGGNFNYSTTGAVNGCTVFAASDGKYWVRQQSPSLSIDACGAKGDGTTIDSAAVSAALAASTYVTCSAGKTYLLGTLITVSSANETLDGSGCDFNPDNRLETISSGTYNSGTGVVTLTMSIPIDFGAGEPIVISSLTGTGAFASLNGSFTTISGTSGSTVVYNGGTGHGAATITGGNLVVGGTVFDIEASGFTGKNLSFRATHGGIPLLFGNSASISNIVLNNLVCDGSGASGGMSDCVHIGNVTDLKLNGFTFKATGYGILGLTGFCSHGVHASNFYASDMYADLMEENHVTACSTDWLLGPGVYDGAHGYPSLATEQRIAGFTSANGIKIIGVQGKNWNGDAALHFEGGAKNIDLSSDTLTGGLGEFVEWNNSNNGITSNDLTCNFTAAGQAPNCFTGVGNSYSNYLFATNTWCNDTSGTAGLTCFDLTQHIGTTNITGGGATGIGTFVSAFATQDVTVTGTTVFAVNGWLGPFGSTSKPSHDVKLSGNKWTCSNWCLFEQNNTGLTTFPTNWSVTANYFDGGAGSLGVDINQGKNVWGTGNWYGSTPTNHTVADNPNTATTEKNDFLQGSGLIHP